MKKILVTGSRLKGNNDLREEAADILWAALDEIEGDIHIIHGGAQGVDTLASEYCHKFDVPETMVPANWNKYGKAAGHIRNKEMLRMNPDVVIAVWDGKSKGTKGCIEEAIKLGFKVDIWHVGK